ncbi:hypothetical protein DW852_06640 [Bifidobacterium pseudocatenulatum]|nr:hypothetical protein DW852_06640 [Bifidobacterium pseudocatenulatum]RHC35227.1 hypothetical protein DW847_06620 [Bifidobacterium pseudocatenulatum]
MKYISYDDVVDVHAIIGEFGHDAWNGRVSGRDNHHFMDRGNERYDNGPDCNESDENTVFD